MEPGELPRLRDQAEILVVHYPTTVFRVGTPGKMRAATWLGPIGMAAAVAAMGSHGEELRTKYSLEDPVLRVRNKVLTAVRENPGLQNLRVREDPVTIAGEDPAELRKVLGSGTVLDFRTAGWGMLYWPMRVETNYRMNYGVVSRLIRLEDAKVLWQGTCTAASAVDAESSPTMEQLEANDGELLKAHVNKVADACAADLAAQFQGKEIAPPKRAPTGLRWASRRRRPCRSVLPRARRRSPRDRLDSA